MKLFNSTTKWKNWWAKRKIDWKAHYMNPSHPHRLIIAEALKHIEWLSLLEVGCGAGANLARIITAMPGRQVGGVDINPDAIAFAQNLMPNGFFSVAPADDIPHSDEFCDVILSDMCMIYVSPFKIDKHLGEFKRLARNYVVFCELHSESWWERLVIKWREGYNIFDWPRLLEKNGFYDIQTYKLTKEDWPESDLQQKYAHLIVARTPKYY